MGDRFDSFRFDSLGDREPGQWVLLNSLRGVKADARSDADVADSLSPEFRQAGFKSCGVDEYDEREYHLAEGRAVAIDAHRNLPSAGPDATAADAVGRWPIRNNAADKTDLVGDILARDGRGGPQPRTTSSQTLREKGGRETPQRTTTRSQTLREKGERRRPQRTKTRSQKLREKGGRGTLQRRTTRSHKLREKEARGRPQRRTTG